MILILTNNGWFSFIATKKWNACSARNGQKATTKNTGRQLAKIILIVTVMADMILIQRMYWYLCPHDRHGDSNIWEIGIKLRVGMFSSTHMLKSWGYKNVSKNSKYNKFIYSKRNFSLRLSARDKVFHNFSIAFKKSAFSKSHVVYSIVL